MKKSTLLVIILYVILSLCAVKINAQDSPKAVILQPKVKVAETKINSQGFNIPVSCSDTTKVYQIGEKGSKFIFRVSKKTGKTYRFYLTEKK